MVCGSAGPGLVRCLHCCFLVRPRGGRAPVHRFLTRLCHLLPRKIDPIPTAGLASTCVSSAVRVTASCVPATVLSPWSPLPSEVKHN